MQRNWVGLIRRNVQVIQRGCQERTRLSVTTATVGDRRHSRRAPLVPSVVHPGAFA